LLEFYLHDTTAEKLGYICVLKTLEVRGLLAFGQYICDTMAMTANCSYNLTKRKPGHNGKVNKALCPVEIDSDAVIKNPWPSLSDRSHRVLETGLRFSPWVPSINTSRRGVNSQLVLRLNGGA